MSPRPLALLVTCAALTVGCNAESTVSAPRVPVPVLLGPIDRVGGHRGGGELMTPLAVEVEDFVAASRSQQTVGRTVYTTTQVDASHEGVNKVSARILRSTDAQHDRDVRVQRLGTGAWIWLTPDLASFMRSEWVALEADVTKEEAR